MISGHLIIEDGIVMFDGRPSISRNLLFEPIVSNAYLLHNDDQVIIFDPSCGKQIGRRIESYIKNEINGKTKSQSVYVIAGHSHFDHSGNLYLSDIVDSGDTHVYIHESGFDRGRILNEPRAFIKKKIVECNKYYNFYLSFFFPYNLLTYPVAALHMICPGLAARIFSILTSLPFPHPCNGSAKLQALKDEDASVVNIAGVDVRGWEVGDKIILSTPGHSPCSLSLLWPEKKALFISDAAWPGNPVFMDASVKDCISTLQLLISLVESDSVELLFSAHEAVKFGKKSIIEVLLFRKQLITAIREEVLSTYLSFGKEKNVRKLTGLLIEKSPIFRMLKKNNYPHFVAFPHTIVALCLKEEGILL